jgi:AraC-like DNA-binding protein
MTACDKRLSRRASLGTIEPMPPGPTVSVHYVRALLGAARALGADPQALLAAADLDPERLQDPDARLPVEALFAVWRHAPRLTGVPHFGLRAAQLAPVGALDVADYAMRACSTLREGLAKLLAYSRIHQTAAIATFEEQADQACVRWALTASAEGAVLQQGAPFVMAVTLSRLRQVSGVDIRPCEVRLRAPTPPDDKEHQAFFRCPVRWAPDESANQLLLDRALLDLPILAADPALARLMDRCARELLEKLPLPETFLSAVRRLVVESLRGGVPAAGVVARRVGMTVRTLQRRLREEGTTFGDVVDEARRELALAHLSAPQPTIGEIAFLLGFSEPSAFHRAFRRWTGTTPSEYRRSRAA